MTTARSAFSIVTYTYTSWRLDWLIGCVLIVLTVIFHVLALGFLSEKAIKLYGNDTKHRHPIVAFAIVIGTTALLATLFHALEVTLWAVA